MDKGGTQTNGPEDEKVEESWRQRTRGDNTDYLRQEKKEEDTPKLKRAWVNQYEDWKTALKREKKKD